MEPKEGQAVELRVEALAAGGRGVARHRGMVWFVPGVVPGDRVLARARRRSPRYVEAVPLRRLEDSPRRRPSPCADQDRCGGCPWMPLAEDAQREWKARLVADALTRLARLQGVALEPVRGVGPPLGYRNRVELTVRFPAGGAPPVSGMHAAVDSAEIVDIERCELQSEPANRVWGTLRRLIGGVAPVIREVDVDYRLTIRRSKRSGEVLVAVWEDETAFPGLEALARALRREHPEVSGVVRVGGWRDGRGGVRVRGVAGREWIHERVLGVDYRLPAASFLQVSTEGAEELGRLVAECAGDVGGRAVIDAYGGVGVHGLHLAARGAGRVTVYEADAAAVACGRRAAREAGLGAVRFVRGDVGRLLATASFRPAIVVANPPRRGLGRGAARAIGRLRPGRIIVVSCDPATLARDLVRICRVAPYRIARVVPVDLFAQTAHVETIVRLDERGTTRSGG